MVKYRELRSRFVAAHGERRTARAEALALFIVLREVAELATLEAERAEERAARACSVRDRMPRPSSAEEAREISRSRVVASLALARAASSAAAAHAAIDRALEAAEAAAALAGLDEPYAPPGAEEEAEAWAAAEARARATVAAGVASRGRP